VAQLPQGRLLLKNHNDKESGPFLPIQVVVRIVSLSSFDRFARGPASRVTLTQRAKNPLQH
jgi:hypothetical protein